MNHLRRPLFVVAAILAANALLLTACQTSGAQPGDGGGPSPAEPRPRTPATRPTVDPVPHDSGGGSLRYALAEPQAIVPMEAATASDLVVVDSLFDPLTAQTPDLEIVPGAALSWGSDASARSWTFRLRPEGRFHPAEEGADPRPVTANDFKRAWEEAVRLGVADFHLEPVEGYEALRRGEAEELVGVEAPSDYVLVVHLVEPHADFPAVVSHPALAPVPAEMWEADPNGFREQPVGNGPFRAAEAWARGQFLRLQRFDAWRRGPEPYLDEIVFQFMDPETAYLAFQQGRLQISPLPDGALEQAEEQYGRSPDGYRGPGVLHGRLPTVYYLGFNVTVPPFDDPAVRRAVSMAIDREGLALDVLGGVHHPARSLTGGVLPGGRSGTCPACRHDPEAARDIFSDRDIEVLTLWFNRDGGHRPIARRVREDLEAAGIRRVEFRAPTFDEYLDVLADGEAGWFRFGWQPEYPTVDDVLRPLLHSSQVSSRNYQRYTNPDVDALLDRARRTRDAEARAALLRRVESIALGEDQVVVPLLFFTHQHVVSEDVVGFILDPLGRPNLHEVELER